MKSESDAALAKENDWENIVLDYSTTNATAIPEHKLDEGEAGKKAKSIFRTLSDWDEKIVGSRRVSKNLLTIPWWWDIGAAKRIFILMFYIFLTGAQFAVAMAGKSMALSTDAVCRVAQIFSHFVSIFPYVFPNSKYNFRNQVVASGVSGFVFLGAIIVLFVDALEEVYFQDPGAVSPIPVIVFGSLGLFLSLLSVGCYNVYFERLEKETRRQGSGTFVIIDSIRAFILIVGASVMFFLPTEESVIDAWSTVLICLCMFYAVIHDLCHWKKFATPFRGRVSRHDNGTMFHYHSSEEKDINFPTAGQIPRPFVTSSLRANATTKLNETLR